MDSQAIWLSGFDIFHFLPKSILIKSIYPHGLCGHTLQVIFPDADRFTFAAFAALMMTLDELVI